MGWKALAFWTAVGCAAWVYLHPEPTTYPRQLKIADAPSQWAPRSSDPWTREGIRFIPLASYHIDGLVIGTARYWIDEMAPFSPVDFYVGWGPMANGELAAILNYRQYGRGVSLEWDARMPLAKKEALLHSANMSLIPADEKIKEQILAVRPGQAITIRGTLVKVQGQGISKTSSLTRSDIDEGSSEILWVEKISPFTPRAVASE